MSSESLLVVVDADALVAQTHSKDANSQKAKRTLALLKKLNAKLIYPVTAISEASTVLQRKLNSPTNAYKMISLIINSEASVVEVNSETFKQALKFFNPNTSKKNTIFDCIVAAIAEEHEADAIFSFDKFYKTLGLRLASELN